MEIHTVALHMVLKLLFIFSTPNITKTTLTETAFLSARLGYESEDLVTLSYGLLQSSEKNNVDHFSTILTHFLHILMQALTYTCLHQGQEAPW